MRKTNQWCDFYIFLERNGHVAYEDRMGSTERKQNGFLVTSDFFSQNEEMVQMIFDDNGGVRFWTDKKIWIIVDEYGMDKLLFLDRNPPEEKE